MLVQRVVRPSVHARRFKYRAFECGRWFWFGGGPIDSPGTDPPELHPPGRREIGGGWCTAPGGGCGCSRLDWPVCSSGQSRRDPGGGGHDEGGVVLSPAVKEDLARYIIAEQHQISIAAVHAIAAQEASAIEQIVMLCHEMARQIVQDPVVRAGIRITLELSADDRGPAGPTWIGSPPVKRWRPVRSTRATLSTPSTHRRSRGSSSARSPESRLCPRS